MNGDVVQYVIRHISDWHGMNGMSYCTFVWLTLHYQSIWWRYYELYSKLWSNIWTGRIWIFQSGAQEQNCSDEDRRTGFINRLPLGMAWMPPMIRLTKVGLWRSMLLVSNGEFRFRRAALKEGPAHAETLASADSRARDLSKVCSFKSAAGQNTTVLCLLPGACRYDFYLAGQFILI